MVTSSGQGVSGLGFSQTLVLDKCLPERFHFNPIDDDDDGWESVYTQDLFQNWHNFADKNNISDYAQNKVWRKRWVPPSHNRSVSKIPLLPTRAQPEVVQTILENLHADAPGISSRRFFLKG